MGLIREPKGVDLVVGPSILKEQERQMISQIIATYKQTGKLPSKAGKKQLRKRKRTPVRKSVVSK